MVNSNLYFVNDKKRLMSIMISYIKTQCKDFVENSLVFNLLWTFKLFKKPVIVHNEFRLHEYGFNTPLYNAL